MKKTCIPCFAWIACCNFHCARCGLQFVDGLLTFAAATFQLAHLPAIALPEAPEEAPEKTEKPHRPGYALAAGNNGEWSAAQLAQAQRRFALDAAQLERASQTATRIRHGAGAWGWDEAHIA